MLKVKKWSRKHDKCIECGTVEEKHSGNGMCKKCYFKKHRKTNREKIKEINRKYYRKNIKKEKERKRRWKNENVEKIKKYNKEYKEKNSKKIKKYNKKYRKENPKKIKEGERKWKEKNFGRFKRSNKNYVKNKRKINVHFKLKTNVSSLIGGRLKKRLLSKNRKSTFDFLPYTVDELKQHLEKQFEPWMNWDNWGSGKGKWNIDHRKPDSLFNYKSIEDEEFQECWALSNLQPLDAMENIKKSNKII
jgi:hypothetical protein